MNKKVYCVWYGYELDDVKIFTTRELAEKYIAENTDTMFIHEKELLDSL